MPSLVFAADDKYAPGLAVAMNSALEHITVTPAVRVLDNGISETSRRCLERIAPIEWITPNPQRLVGDRPSAYSRLLAPELIDGRIIYLDSDLLVRRDLAPLFKMKLSAPFGAVQDALVTTTDHERSGAYRNPARRYFNSGVLVIDAQAWRDARLTERALEYGASERPEFFDQDSLNAVADDWHELHPRWNVQQCNLVLSGRHPWRDREAWWLFSRAAVWHWVGLNPWHPGCEVRGTQQWLKAAQRLPAALPSDRARSKRLSSISG